MFVNETNFRSLKNLYKTMKHIYVHGTGIFKRFKRWIMKLKHIYNNYIEQARQLNLISAKYDFNIEPNSERTKTEHD